MRIRGRLVVVWSALALVGCPHHHHHDPPCSASTTTAIDLDGATAYGSPREALEQITDMGRMASDLHWSYPTDDSLPIDTTVNLLVDRGATAAAFGADDHCPPTFAIDTALRFETLDGAFDGAIAGTLTANVNTDEGPHFQDIRFTAYPTSFGGTYDLERVTRHFEHPQIELDTSLYKPTGFIRIFEADQADATSAMHLADWNGDAPVLVVAETPGAGGQAGGADVAGNGGVAGGD